MLRITHTHTHTHSHTPRQGSIPVPTHQPKPEGDFNRRAQKTRYVTPTVGGGECRRLVSVPMNLEGKRSQWTPWEAESRRAAVKETQQGSLKQIQESSHKRVSFKYVLCYEEHKAIS